jgi:hypothetical protein
MDYDTKLKDNILDNFLIILQSKTLKLHHICINTPNQVIESLNYQ